jgi:glycosyltransferase involved in cell wall biosynthesis
MRIAFVSKWGPDNIHAWSGTPYFMCAALRQHGFDVKEIGPLKFKHSFAQKVKRRIYKLVNRHYDIERHPDIAKSYAQQVQKVLDQEPFDLIISPSSIPIAYLKAQIPIVFWTDATFASMVGFYPGNWSSLATETLRQGNALERRAIQTASLCAYSSGWAADSAMRDYAAAPDKVACIPFGANFQQAPQQNIVETAIARRSTRLCKLLFIGVEWLRKGGDLVIETANLLRTAGVDVQVDIVGCDPIGPTPDFVIKHGFISKSDPEGRIKLQTLLLDAHFLFVPSLAECYGLVFAEASAHGVPSIARAVGGIPSVIRNGANGQIFDVEAPASEYAAYIRTTFLDSNRYQTAARQSRIEFDTRLNWTTAINAFAIRAQTLVQSTQPSNERSP